MSRLGKHQVVVIGGGIIGCAAAYFLARDRVDVALVEKAPQVGLEASGCNAGGVRRNSRHRSEMPLATASLELWLRFRDELGGNFFFEQRGHIYCGRNEAEMDLLRKLAADLQGQGVPVQHLSESEIRKLVPGLGSMVRGGNFCPTDAYAEPFQATLFIGQCARRAGATLYLDTRVIGLQKREGRVHTVQTSRGEISTEAVVSAVGPWCNEIAGMLGTKLPVIPRRTQMLVSMAVPTPLRHNIAGNRSCVHKTQHGGLLVGVGGPWEATGFASENTRSALRRFTARSGQLWPPLMQANWLRAWSSTYGISPDNLNIIDRFPEAENVAFAAGDSGHSFALGPGVGKVLAEMTQGKPPSISIAGLGLDRFPPGLDIEAVYQRAPEPL